MKRATIWILLLGPWAVALFTLWRQRELEKAVASFIRSAHTAMESAINTVRSAPPEGGVIDMMEREGYRGAG